MIFIFLFCLSRGTVVQSLLPFACGMGRAWHVLIVNCLYQELSSLQSWMLEQGAPSSDFGHFKTLLDTDTLNRFNVCHSLYLQHKSKVFNNLDCTADLLREQFRWCSLCGFAGLQIQLGSWNSFWASICQVAHVVPGNLDVQSRLFIQLFVHTDWIRRWDDDNGCWWPDKILFLRAIEDLKAGDVLLRVPSSLHISPSYVRSLAVARKLWTCGA